MIARVARAAPPASSSGVRDRMRGQRRRDTACEVAIRRALHALGFRFRIDARPIPSWRRRADIVFRRAGVAVFVDGCFWHGCPRHSRPPRANARWWSAKIERTRRRDLETTAELKSLGWHVLRVWEHESPVRAARRIAEVVRARLPPGARDTATTSPGRTQVPAR